MTDQLSKYEPILVTGATGHTGRRLVQALVDRKVQVRILTREPAKLAVELRRQVDVFRGDITSPENAQQAVSGCGAVIAVTHIKFAPYIIAAMQAAGVRRGVCMSSTRRFTKFVEETARQVMAGEKALEESGLEYTIIRPTMIYGGKQDNNLEPLLQTLKKWPVFPLPAGGRMLWQPVFTWDVIAAMIAALERPESIGKAYTIAGPAAITYRHMIETMLREAGLKRTLVPLPLGLARAVVSAHEKMSKRPVVRLDQIRRMEEDKNFDISEAQRDLGFSPISFEEGIRRKIKKQV